MVLVKSRLVARRTCRRVKDCTKIAPLEVSLWYMYGTTDIPFHHVRHFKIRRLVIRKYWGLDV